MFDRIDPALLPFIDSEARQLLQGRQLPAEDHQALLEEAKWKRDFIEASIPEPTLDNLRQITHADTLPRFNDPDVQAALKREWYDNHRADALQRAKESGWRDLSKEPTPRSPEPSLGKSTESSTKAEQFEALHKILGSDETSESPDTVDSELPDQPKGVNIFDLAKRISEQANSEEARGAVDGLRRLADSLRADEESFRQKIADMAKPMSIPQGYGFPEVDTGWQEQLAEREEARRKAETEEQHRAIANAVRDAFREASIPIHPPQEPPKPANPPGSFGADEELPHSEDKRHTEWLWAATGVVVTIVALVFWGFLFVFAWGLYAIGVYKSPWFSREPEPVRFAKKGVIDALIAFGLLAVWWFAPIPEFAKPHEELQGLKPSPEIVRAPSPKPSPSIGLTPTPSTTQVATPSVGAADAPQTVLKEIPFKGGTPQRLDVIMKAAGYTGPTRMAVLYVRSSDANEIEIIVGTRPDLSAKNSWIISQSEWVPFEGGEDTTRVYVLASKEAKLDVTFKPR